MGDLILAANAACLLAALWYARAANRFRRDALTGCLLRAAVPGRVRRTGSVVLVDLDGLKATNDRLGYAEGDRRLALAGAVLRSSVRRGNVVRWGGDEFLVWLPGCDPVRAETVAERLRRALAAAGVPATAAAAPAVSGELLAQAAARAAAFCRFRKRPPRTGVWEVKGGG